MDIITYPQGSVLYDCDEKPRKVYYLLEGEVSVKVHKKEVSLDSGTFGEWSWFSMPSEEKITVSSSEATFYVFEPQEVFQSKEYLKILKSAIPSISKRLLIADSELAECQKLPEYVGPDRLRYFKRVHPNSYKLDDRIFQDILNAKRFYASGYYKEAFDILVKLLPEVVSEDLKKEIMVLYTLLSVILDPEHAELYFRRLNPKDYIEHLSYLYLRTFLRGGKNQDILEVFMKAGLYTPPYTIVTLEGDVAQEGYLVVKGYLKAVKIYENKEVLLSIVQPGEFVGESALLDTKTRMVTLYSISPASIIPINCESIEKSLQTNPNFILRICESQLKRIKQVKSLIKIKNIPNPIQRIDWVISYFQELFSKVKITAKDISNLIDVNVEHVIEELKRKGFRITLDGSIEK